MKYVSFEHDGVPSWGIAAAAGIIDPGTRVRATFPDLRSYIAAGFPCADAYIEASPAFAWDDIILSPVVPNPAMIIMAAINYFAEDAKPTGAPEYPVLFLRLPSSQIGHRAPLIRPRESHKLDFEGELAVIIGKPGRHIPRERAMSHVAGYACYNDGSVRDWQKHSHQFTPGKNFVGTGAFGPWMVTADELPDPQGLSLVTRVICGTTRLARAFSDS